MIQQLKLFHFPPEINSLDLHGKDFFHLTTCQRTLYLGFSFIPHSTLQNFQGQTEIFVGSHAYKFLLETICGLRSKIIGENEIVSQFKSSFSEYLGRKNRNPQLIRVLEKILQDSKRVRTKHLSRVGQQSYAGITRQLLEKKNASKKALILGNGALSQSVVKLLKKRFDLYVTGRNPKKIELFQKINDIKPIKWLDFSSWSRFQFIINTIGAKETLIDDTFFHQWVKNHPEVKMRQFVDLGTPSVLNTSLKSEHGVAKLNDIFKTGDIMEQEKKFKVGLAKIAIEELTNLRMTTLCIKEMPGFKEQKFA